MPTPLSEALKTETAAAHTRAEDSAFVEQLIAGGACAPAFTALVAQQLVFYRAMEDVLHRHYLDDPLVGAVADRKLDRVPALELDMAHHFGPDYDVRLATGEIRICPATTAYATAFTTAHSPEMMLANHYVRYLGDLSGGQIIARMVGRHYGIPDEGLHFYRFAEIPKPRPYKDAYRARLDALDLTPVQRGRVIEAAVESFEQNRRIFADLEHARVPEHAAAGAPQ